VVGKQRLWWYDIVSLVRSGSCGAGLTCLPSGSGFCLQGQNHGCLCLCEYCCVLLISSLFVFALSSCSVLLPIYTLNTCPTYIPTSSFSSGIVGFYPSKSQFSIFLPASHYLCAPWKLCLPFTSQRSDFQHFCILNVQLLVIFSKCLSGWKQNNKLFTDVYFSWQMFSEQWIQEKAVTVATGRLEWAI